MSERYLFKVLVYPSGNAYEAYVPALDARTQGDDFREAIYMAQDLAEALLSCYAEADMEVPQEADVDGLWRDAPDGGCVVMLLASPGREAADMTLADAADVLGTTEARVREMLGKGALEARMLGRTPTVSTESVRRLQNDRVRDKEPALA